jgi:TRAP-type C4-dicarboxylate transport system substrate-binding protein
LDEVKKAGVKVIYPDKTLFSSKVEDVYNLYNNDPIMKKLIDQIKNTN